jgi:hypothetical protein
MANQNIWIVKFVAGNPLLFQKIKTAANGPFKRSTALANAQTIANNNWRVWVEHQTTGKRIFESVVEKAFKVTENSTTEGC